MKTTLLDRLQNWIDNHFFGIVPILVIVGCMRWDPPSDSLLGGLQWIAPFLCGSIGCFFWALYLRKDSPAKWIVFGLIPYLAPVYLLGWHRAHLRAQRAADASPPDCPRCERRLSGAGRCADSDGNHPQPAI